MHDSLRSTVGGRAGGRGAAIVVGSLSPKKRRIKDLPLWEKGERDVCIPEPGAGFGPVRDGWSGERAREHRAELVSTGQLPAPA